MACPPVELALVVRHSQAAEGQQHVGLVRGQPGNVVLPKSIALRRCHCSLRITSLAVCS